MKKRATCTEDRQHNTSQMRISLQPETQAGPTNKQTSLRREKRLRKTQSSRQGIAEMDIKSSRIPPYQDAADLVKLEEPNLEFVEAMLRWTSIIHASLPTKPALTLCTCVA